MIRGNNIINWLRIFVAKIIIRNEARIGNVKNNFRDKILNV